MTLKELFLSVDFDRVWAVLLNHYPEMIGCRIGMKQAYDQIRLITPEPDDVGEKIEVGIGHDGNRKYIRVMHCSNHYRRIVVGREVIVDPKVNITVEELAAHCLWELTYWGFDDEDTAENFRDHGIGWGTEKPVNKYWAEYQEKDSQWFPPVRLEEYTPMTYNRSKRKREYRRIKRLRQLRRYAKIEELQQELVHDKVYFDLWPILKDCKTFTVATDRSYADVPEEAENYLYDLYTKYEREAETETDGDAVTILIVTGGNKVGTDLHRLREAIERHHVNPCILVGNRDADQFKVRFIKAYGVKNRPKT